MNEKKKPDLVVWDEENGYNSNIKEYPTNIGAPAFQLPNVSLIRTEASKKMMSVFEREREELIIRAEKLSKEFNDSLMVWESKIPFEPIVGKTYYLYNFNGVKTLSLLSPNEWNKQDCFLGGFTLNSENKWLRTYESHS
jgi:hypothetical protein